MLKLPTHSGFHDLFLKHKVLLSVVSNNFDNVPNLVELICGDLLELIPSEDVDVVIRLHATVYFRFAIRFFFMN